jgi:hypothetical protein
VRRLGQARPTSGRQPGADASGLRRSRREWSKAEQLAAYRGAVGERCHRHGSLDRTRRACRQRAPHASPWLTAVDVAVGVAFVAAGVLAGGPLCERVLVAAVGPAWLAGSLLVAARPLHQAMLAVALVAFPGGRVRGAASWVLVTLAGLTALQFMSQLGVAALFALIAVVALARSRSDPVAAWYPAAASASTSSPGTRSGCSPTSQAGLATSPADAQ